MIECTGAICTVDILFHLVCNSKIRGGPMNLDVAALKKDADQLKSGLGVVAWAVLEMFKRGGMPESELKNIKYKMDLYFPKPNDMECNAILKVVEARLQEDKQKGSDIWYS